MKNSLDFKIPFTQFGSTNFINCFASTYMFLEKIGVKNAFKCKKQADGNCNYCGRCSNEQTQYYFLFHTMSGGCSARCSSDGTKTEMQKFADPDSEDGGTNGTIDFLFGFAGYEYRKCADKNVFKNEVKASIDAGVPVIARAKSNVQGHFRVITGYDGDALINPDYANALQQPKDMPTYDDLEVLYIFGEKTAPRYTLKDGLERIRHVMEHDIRAKIWDGHIEKVHSNIDGVWKLRKRSIKQTEFLKLDAVICIWFCHTFKETFMHTYHEELRNPALSEIRNKVEVLCNKLHDHGHAINFLNLALKYGIDANIYNPAAVSGMNEMVWNTLKAVKQLDVELLEVIKQGIDILKEEN